jgi:hypothetical protein
MISATKSDLHLTALAEGLCDCEPGRAINANEQHEQGNLGENARPSRRHCAALASDN